MSVLVIRRLVTVCWGILCVISLGFLALAVHDHLAYQTHTNTTQVSKIRALNLNAVREINLILKLAETRAAALAETLSRGVRSKQWRIDRLEAMISAHPNFFGATVTFREYGADQGIRLYSDYVTRRADTFAYSQLGRTYDYTDSQWFAGAMAGGNQWSNPYFCNAGNKMMTTYSAVFYDGESPGAAERALGVVTLDITLETISNIIRALDLGTCGYGALTTREGIYLYHPKADFVSESKTIYEVARENQDRDRIFLSGEVSDGRSGVIDHSSITTGLDSWLVYDVVPATGWSLQSTFIKSDIMLDYNALRQQWIHILSAAIISAICLACLGLRLARPGHFPAVLASVVTAVAFLAGIGGIWHFALAYPENTRMQGTLIAQPGILDKIMAAHSAQYARKNKPLPIFVPTGVHFDSLDISKDNDVELVGRIWQRYPWPLETKQVPDLMIINAKSFTMDPILDVTRDGERLRQWQFKALLQKQATSPKYPLDRKRVAVVIRPKGGVGRVALVPDIGAYRVISPTSLPGIRDGDAFPGWRILKTFFQLREVESKTTFGLNPANGVRAFPELVFNIDMNRNFLDVFISNLAPLFIVACMLYFLILILTGDGERLKIRGTEPGKTLSYCSCLLFVVVFSHIGVRRSIAAQEVFYLEYFHLVMYAALLLASLNCVLFIWTDSTAVGRPRDNFLAKVLFWPVILGVLFAITAATFY